MATYELTSPPNLSTALDVLFPAADDQELRLSRAALRGDRAAFSELVRRNQSAVYGLCYRLLGEREAAADAAQEAFVRAYAALHTFDIDQRFDIWLLRIARNHSIDLLRRRTNQAVVNNVDGADAPDIAPSAQEQLESAEVTHHLEAALDTLSTSDREILVLYYVQHRKTREIAEVLGVAPGTVMARLFRARQKLRKQMTQEQEASI